ncbi:hypothetical protein [Synechococcus sp. PCC 7336]|uniref:hypothetical protein n=1 Tax=Synechococcus sp. PCC 7336 TaxID=195250 RepID=UPI000349FD3B|nr:hypothetical protein [Synechococcus sp. PCC 7336]
MALTPGPSPKFGRGEKQPETLNLPFGSPSPRITADATLREGGEGARGWGPN